LRHQRITFAVVLTATAAFSMLVSLVVPVLPLIQRDLGTDQGTITWVLTAYLLAASVATPIVGRIGDSYGKKRTLVAVLAVFGAGTVLAALAQSVGLLIAARAIQGVGGAILPLGFGILRDELPPARVNSAVSTTAASVGVGGGLGIVLAGPIASGLGYHFVFWIPLVLVVIAAVATLVAIPESPGRSGARIDARPAVLLAAALVALLLPVSQGHVWGWTAPRTLALLAAAAVLTYVWIRAELRSPSPVVDMRMMRLPAVWTTNLVALLFGVCMYSVIAALPQFLQTPAASGYGFGASVTEAGLLLSPMPVVMFLTGLFAAPLAERIGTRRVLLAGAAFTALPFLLLACGHGARSEILLTSTILGAGMGFAFAAISSIIVAAVPAHQTGVASGMNANIRTIGGSIGAAVTTTIVTSHAGANGLPLESGYTEGFTFLLVAGVVAIAAATLIPQEGGGRVALPRLASAVRS
jgi:EmrB/QacA subfamily drug resistance transporter